jgi:transposase InsO family protein/transposase
VEQLSAFDQLQLRFRDPVQRRYEIIRPVLLEECTAAERATHTHLHPDTIGKLKRRFEQQGMLGLFPAHVEISTRGRQRQVPETVVEELQRLKGLYGGFHYRELGRILYYKTGHQLDHKTIKRLWQQLPHPPPSPLPRLDYHSHAARPQARAQVITLYCQGWTKISISRFLHVSRPTVREWLHRFEQEDLSGLEDKSRAPKAPARKAWLPLMIAVYHLQKRHPDAGRFRIWSLLGQDEVSVRTIGRVMALNKRVYDDIPHGRRQRAQHDPQPHPYKAQSPHEVWFIDGRQMDFKLHGIKWWSIVLLEGYSRTMLAAAVAPSEASWVAMLVLYTACRQYGAPQRILSDSGGAYISNEFEAVCARLEIEHITIVSTQGESWLNIMETHFNVQRRLYDYQFSLTQSPSEFEQLHQVFLKTYNTTAHAGLIKDGFATPIPLVVLGDAKGRLYTEEALAQKFSRALFPRTTNRHGCVTLHRYHFYVAEGVPQTQVLLWVYEDQLRAVVDSVVLAEYHCRYDGQARQVRDISHGTVYATRFTSPQGSLIPRKAEESLVVYHPKAPRRPVGLPLPAQQLWLFELVHPA